MEPDRAAIDTTSTGRPRVVDVAAALVLAAAVVNVAIGVLVVVQARVSSAAVPGVLVAAVLVISVAYAAALVVLVMLFVRGRTWARGALVGAAALSLLTLFALNALNLLVILLLLAATVLLYRRRVSQWVRVQRGLPPG